MTFIVLCFFVFERFCLLTNELGFFQFTAVLMLETKDTVVTFAELVGDNCLYVPVNVPQT